jgi:hypothetical protein
MAAHRMASVADARERVSKGRRDDYRQQRVLSDHPSNFAQRIAGLAPGFTADRAGRVRDRVACPLRSAAYTAHCAVPPDLPSDNDLLDDIVPEPGGMDREAGRLPAISRNVGDHAAA